MAKHLRGEENKQEQHTDDDALSLETLLGIQHRNDAKEEALGPGHVAWKLMQDVKKRS